MTLVEEVKAQNQTLILLVQQLVAQSINGQELDIGPLPEGIVLPLDTMEELDHIVLVQDPDVKGKLVSKFING